MRRITLFLTMPVVLAAALPLRAFAYDPKVGERHPDFTLPDIATGKPVSLADLRGKRVLLIHFSSW